MVHLFGMDLTREQLETHVGRLDQIGGITPVEYADGRARGERALQIVTGSGLSVTAVADRALDLAHASYRGIPLCWRSPNGDAMPTYYYPGEDGFLRQFFGGLMTTCGLTNFGPGGTDRYGTVPMHGHIDNLPAEDVRWTAEWQGDECILSIEGTVRQTRVFGENLRLDRRISTQLGSTSLKVEDTVTNEGYERTPHMILYHCNGGFPLLTENARLYVSSSAMRPRDAEAEKGVDVWNRGAPPQPGFKEQVFIHTPAACSDGRAVAALINRDLQGGEGLGLAVRFDPSQLPAMIQWRMLGQGTYVMAVEPANCPTIEGRKVAEERGTLPFLEPGESRRYEIEFQVLTSRTEIDALVSEIEEVRRSSANG